MRIGEAAADAGVNIQTFRYYERRGLLRQTARRPSGFRDYSPDAVRAVRFIKRTQARALAAAKIADIDRKIHSLHAMKRSLVRLVASCAGAPSDDCSCAILDSLEYE